MSKKHYIYMAKMLRMRKGVIDRDNKMSDDLKAELLLLHSMIVEDLADCFQRDNSAFDRQRFYTACGLNDEVAS